MARPLLCERYPKVQLPIRLSGYGSRFAPGSNIARTLGKFVRRAPEKLAVQEVLDMLYYALLFLVVALIAGFLGFGGIAFAAAGIAKILFFVFLLVFIVTLIMHLTRGGTARG